MPKIDDRTFVVVSKHFGDAEWIKDYTDNYQIFDKSEDPLGFRSIRIPNVGFNLLAYFTYIIEHYENLPDFVMFIKNNCIGRHFSKEYFESVMNNHHFTGMADPNSLQFHKPYSYWDNGYWEQNGLNWYNNLKYVRNYNELMDFIYVDQHYPGFIRFAPGANYIVPKGQLLRLPKSLYQDLRTMVEHSQLSGESYLMERALDTIWTNSDWRLRPTREIKTL